MKFLCPVCGYWELPRPAQEDLICPCCGIQFGYHDYGTEHRKLRQSWIASGAHWHSRVHAAPPGWNALTQLARAAMLVTFEGSSAGDKNETDVQVTVNYPATAVAA